MSASVLGTSCLGSRLASVRQPLLRRSSLSHSLSKPRPLQQRSFKPVVSSVSNLHNGQVSIKSYRVLQSPLIGQPLPVRVDSCCCVVNRSGVCRSCVGGPQRAADRTSRQPLAQQARTQLASFQARKNSWASLTSPGQRFCLWDSCSSASSSTTPSFVIQR